MPHSVLLVIPDKQSRSMLSLLLRDIDFQIDSCPDPVEAFEQTGRKNYGLVILAYEQSLTQSDQWVLRMRKSRPQTAILLMVRKDDLEFVLPLFPLGIADVLVYPFNPKTVVAKLRRFAIGEEAKPPPVSGATTSPFASSSLLHFEPHLLTGHGEAFHKLKEGIASTRAAKTGVLLRGEPGCEFELVMREIAAINGDAHGYPMVFDASEIDADLLSSLDAQNRLEEGAPLTVYISRVDRVGEETRRVILDFLRGVNRRQRANPRSVLLVLSYAHTEAEAAEHSSTFVEELLFFISHEIVQPPLRERREDIPLLARRILLDLIHLNPAVRVRSIDQSAFFSLTNRSWRGNYAELVSVLRRAVLACAHRLLRMEHIDPYLVTDYHPDADLDAEVAAFAKAGGKRNVLLPASAKGA
jgi:DNA-binding NtrC family response regulator